ncbi:hypothetical protein STRIP9103_04215 [Streptomyces ipomoeae 91-03]|uniref:Uncharacterized protein n=1 Tax=Streptomyces ipomoeae 91-03 TaxID=698759 RepID=L1KHZ0_9ACTN|nr:hypothetical protein STRIP9103_04215 [Streptomyces ipomoeae 91-03]
MYEGQGVLGRRTGFCVLVTRMSDGRLLGAGEWWGSRGRSCHSGGL